MVAITAISGTPSALPQAMAHSRLEQAQRDAIQAENHARNLRAQADRAERDAQQSQERVRELNTRSSREDVTYESRLRSDRSDFAAQAGSQSSGGIVDLMV